MEIKGKVYSKIAKAMSKKRLVSRSNTQFLKLAVSSKEMKKQLRLVQKQLKILNKQPANGSSSFLSPSRETFRYQNVNFIQRRMFDQSPTATKYSPIYTLTRPGTGRTIITGSRMGQRMEKLKVEKSPSREVSSQSQKKIKPDILFDKQLNNRFADIKSYKDFDLNCDYSNLFSRGRCVNFQHYEGRKIESWFQESPCFYDYKINKKVSTINMGKSTGRKFIDKPTSDSVSVEKVANSVKIVKPNTPCVDFSKSQGRRDQIYMQTEAFKRNQQEKKRESFLKSLVIQVNKLNSNILAISLINKMLQKQGCFAEFKRGSLQFIERKKKYKQNFSV